VAQLLAVAQPGRLVTDGGTGVHRRGEGQGETWTLGLVQRACLCEALWGLVGKGVDRLTECGRSGGSFATRVIKPSAPPQARSSLDSHLAMNFVASNVMAALNMAS
jgi:hypothetical protein